MANTQLEIIPIDGDRPPTILAALSKNASAPMNARDSNRNMGNTADEERPHYGETPNGSPFDPTKCEANAKGYVYWAARDQVFRFRFDPNQPIYPRTGRPTDSSDAENIPPAPDSKSPEGCYGNPLRGQSVPYLANFGDALFRKLTGRKMNTSTGRAWSHGYFAPSDRLLSYKGYELRKKWYDENEKKGNCGIRSSRMSECMSNKDANRNDQRLRRILRVHGELVFSGEKERQDIYVTFGDALGAAEVPIQSEFNLYNAVTFRDNFNIFPHEIDLLIPYYQGMIRFLMDAHVPEYRWKRPKTK